jgi:F420-dependent oxidoreductase-like protein
MDLGLHYWNFSAPGNPERIADTLAAAAQTAEEAGFAEFSVMDHYFQIEQRARAEEPMLEAYTTLGYVAAVTKRMRLAVLVTGVMYRYPGLLAKILTTLDALSGGRAQLGIGASWYEREQRGLGVPLVSAPERFERLEETVQICLKMWSNDNGPYLGKHYQLAETLCVPAPLSRPRPPILIGGGGERKTLRLVARYADACNLLGSSPDEVAHKLDVLRAHCEAEGRDFDAIRKTAVYSGPVLDDVVAFVADAKCYAALGITQLDVVPDRDPVEYTERLATIAPRLAEL